MKVRLIEELEKFTSLAYMNAQERARRKDIIQAVASDSVIHGISSEDSRCIEMSRGQNEKDIDCLGATTWRKANNKEQMINNLAGPTLQVLLAAC